MGIPQYPTPAAPQQLAAGPPPVLVAAPGPAPQNRLTVLVRLILVIPQAFVLFFIAIAAAVVSFIGWWGALFMGRLPDFAADFLTGWIRWSSRVTAYTVLLTGKYPPFTLEDVPDYPVRIATTRERLNRWAVFFRFILVIPVYILGGVLSYGAFTIVGFVAWIIALFTGRLPDSLHLAYAAVFRFQVRLQCYTYLLTPTYPGGLFGDGDQPPPAPGYGAPGGYGDPNPPGYGAPGSGAPGYGAPGYGAPGYGGQGWEPQRDTPSGYGAAAAPGGYGAPPAAAQPDWRLILTPSAKRLVIFFIVLGAILYIGGSVANNVILGKSVNDRAAAVAANSAMQTAAGKLDQQAQQFQSDSQGCNGDVQCLQRTDAKGAAAFSQFARTVRDTDMPSNAQAAASTLATEADKVAADLTQLSQAASQQQYQSLLTSSGLRGDTTKFDSDQGALQNAIQQALNGA